MDWYELCYIVKKSIVDACGPGVMTQLALRYGILDPVPDAIKLKNVIKKSICFLLQVTKVKTASVHDKKGKGKKNPYWV